MKKDYFKIVYKSFLLVLPLLVLLVYYFIADPFKVVHHYDRYYESGKAPIVILNKDYVTTETFLNNYRQYHYDSYIFGSSRSMFFRVHDWQQYIHSDKCYHFDAWKESLYGMYLKLKLLDQQHADIKNVLVVLDTSVLEVTDNSYRDANLYMKHPLLSGSGTLSFQYQFIKPFFDLRFLTAYAGYRITGEVKPYMRNMDVFDEKPMLYNDTTNEIQWYYTDSVLAANTDSYYREHSDMFIERDKVLRVSKVVIHEKQKLMLQEMHDILVRHGSSYKIIITPHYMQHKLNTEDLAYLEQLFGKENVFDFSGKNVITEDKHNYYDMGHFRPEVARYLLSVVYAGVK